MLTGDPWLLLLAAAVVGAAGVAFVLRPRLGGLDVAVHLPARTQIGLGVPCTFVVRNAGPRTSPLTRIAHRIDGLDDVAILVEPLVPGGRASVTVERHAVARSAPANGLALLTSSAPFGLILAQRPVELPAGLVVHPVVAAVPRPPDSTTQTTSDRARIDRAGTDLHGVREWAPGDAARQVHWRSTARRGRLVVLERESPLAPGLTILVAGPSGGPMWEPLVSLVASTAVSALRDGHPVSLVTAQAGLPDSIGAGATALLDWCSRLAQPRWLELGTVSRALAATGTGGDLLVATDQPDGPWRGVIEADAGRAGVRVLQLRLPAPWVPGQLVPGVRSDPHAGLDATWTRR